MADNTTLPGTGESIASDDIAGIKYQRIKLIHGADGVNAGDVSAANPYPVSGPLTDAQLRAAVVPVSLTSTTVTGSVAVTGAFFQATQPVSFSWAGLTDTQLRATAVPTSLATLPTLPTGANTIGAVTAPGAAALALDATLTGGTLKAIARAAAKGATAAADLTSNPVDANTQALHVNLAGTNAVNATLSAETTKVIGTVNIAVSQTVGLVAGANVIGKVGIDQTTPGTTNGVQVTNATLAVTGTFFQATQPVSAASLPLPTGAATETTVAAISAAQGAAADAAATTDAGTFSLIALVKRLLGKFTTGAQTTASSLAVAIATDQVALPMTSAVVTASGNITTQNLVPAGAATAGSAVEITLAGTTTLFVQVTGTYTGALSLQLTADGTNWITVGGVPLINLNTGGYLATITSALQSVFQADVGGAIKARITGLAAMTGTATVTLRANATAAIVALDAALPTGTNSIGNLGTVTTVTTCSTLTTLANGQTAHSSASTGSPVRIGGRVNTAIDTTLVAGDASDLFMTTSGAAVTKPYAAPELDWQFASAAGGITNTTDVVLKAAGAAGVRNYITGISLQNASATVSTEVVVKDGATIIWRGFLGMQSLLNSAVGITFPTPLRGTAATAMNVACITTASAVYVNAQGCQAP